MKKSGSRTRLTVLWLGIYCCFISAFPVFGQIKFGELSDAEKANEARTELKQSSKGPQLGKPQVIKYRAGMIFEARPKSECSNIIGAAPVPMDFPEQKVRVLEENFPSVAKVTYRELKEGGAKELLFKMKKLHAGQQVEATVIFEVTRYPWIRPEKTDCYFIPKNVPRSVTRYKKRSQYMQSDSSKIRSLAKEIVKEKDNDWDKVEALFNYVRENVMYEEETAETKPMRGALAALENKKGDCEDMCALFIALCRAQDIPARLVRVPGHCYAEFYLVDDEKEGYWFPAQVSGTEPMGGLQDTRVILQKGDSFKLPESPKEETLYVKELFMGETSGADPVYQFIQEQMGR